MRCFVELAALPSRGRFRSLKISSAVLLLLLLASAPWRPAVALESWSQPWWPGGPVWCGDPPPPGLEELAQCNDPEGVIIAVSDATGTEGTDATLDFVVSLSEPHPFSNVMMDWSIEAFTATAGEDYTDASGTLTIALGETTGTISIPLLDDSVSEGVETLKLKLADAIGATFVITGMAIQRLSARGTILPDEDTDAPTVTVTTKYPVTPPVSGFFTVIVEFSEPVTGFEMSDLLVTNGSPAQNQNTDRFNEHGMTKWRVDIVADEDLNGDVTVVVPAGVATDSLGNSNTASEPFVIAARGHTSSAPKAWLRCSGSSDPASWTTGPKSVTVGYGIVGFYAGRVDIGAYSLTNEDGVDAAGLGAAVCTGPDSGIACVNNNRIREGMTGQLTLQILAGAALIRGSPTAPSDKMLISGLDWAVSVADASATEGTDETIDFEVRLNAQDDCKAVKVDWAISDGTATAGEDYTAASGTLTFNPGETVKTISISVLEDDATDGEETLTLTLSNPAGVELTDAEATGTISDVEPVEALTARFESVPESHDGSTAFTFDLHFSENIPGLSYKTVAGDLVEITGANVTGARRLTKGSNQGWRVTVEPSANDDISITLPARACGETAAICTSDNRALSEGISATVQMVLQPAQQSEGPLTASFENVPESHDGTTAFTVEVHFSEAPSRLSYVTVRDGLFDVTNGAVTKAGRVTRGSNLAFVVTVQPSADTDVTLTVRGTDDCAAPHAICRGDGRKLVAGASATIAMGTPIAVTVADTEVEEAEGATLDFVVSMNHAAAHDIQIWYRAYDGTATAGADYVAVSSSFTMTAGETTKTVSVSVLDDAHDEGAETVNFWLSGVRGLSASQLTDPYAVGTIHEFSDPMPAAVDYALRTDGGEPGDRCCHLTFRGRDGLTRMTIGGQRIGVSELFEAADTPVFEDLRQWAEGDENDRAEWRDEGRALTGREILLGSSFHLSAGNGAEGGTAFTAWGEVATGGFEADVDDVRMDGAVTTGMIGIDAEWDRLLAGVMLSRSEGDGKYRLSAALGNDGGTVESSLTGVYPYLRLEMGEGVSAWGLAGYGTGSLTLRQDGQDPIETDLGMRMGAVGARGTVLDRPSEGGLELAVKSDAMWVQTESDRTVGLESAEGDVTRVRVILEGDRVFNLGDDETLTPKGEIGLRHDGGDAETGTGVEIGAGIRYAGGTVSVEASVRTLVAHEESGYEEWGASGAIHVSPDASGRGLSLSIASGLGKYDRRDGSAVVGGRFNGFWARQRLSARRSPRSGVGLRPRAFRKRKRADPLRGPRIGRWREPGLSDGLALAGGSGRHVGSRGRPARSQADGNGAEHGLMLRGKMRW